MGTTEERTLKIKRRQLPSGEWIDSIPLPVLNVKLIPIEKVVPNSYNPNKMQNKIMRLLIISILEDGFLFPVLGIWDNDMFHVIDGEHRYHALRRIGAKFVPSVELKRNLSERRIMTERMNKTRGVHQLDKQKENFQNLLSEGSFTLPELSQKMALEAEEIVIYKKKGSIVEEFKNQDFSNAWERDKAANIMYKPQKEDYDEYDDEEL